MPELWVGWQYVSWCGGTLGQVNQSQDLVCYGNLSLQVVAYLVALLWVREGLIVAYVVQLLLL